MACCRHKLTAASGIVADMRTDAPTDDPIAQATERARRRSSAGVALDKKSTEEFALFAKHPEQMYVEILELRRAVRDTEAERTSSRVQLKQLQEELARLKRRDSKYRGHEDAAQAAVHASAQAEHAELERARRRITELEQQVHARTNELEAALDVNVANVRTDRFEVLDELVRLRTAAAASTTPGDSGDGGSGSGGSSDDVGSLRRQMQRLEQQNAALKRQVDEWRSKAQSVRPGSAQSVIAVKQQQRRPTLPGGSTLPPPSPGGFSAGAGRGTRGGTGAHAAGTFQALQSPETMSHEELVDTVRQFQRGILRDSLGVSMDVSDVRSQQMASQIAEIMATQDALAVRVEQLQNREVQLLQERERLLRQVQELSSRSVSSAATNSVPGDDSTAGDAGNGVGLDLGQETADLLAVSSEVKRVRLPQSAADETDLQVADVLGCADEASSTRRQRYERMRSPLVRRPRELGWSEVPDGAMQTASASAVVDDRGAHIRPRTAAPTTTMAATARGGSVRGGERPATAGAAVPTSNNRPRRAPSASSEGPSSLTSRPSSPHKTGTRGSGGRPNEPARTETGERRQKTDNETAGSGDEHKSAEQSASLLRDVIRGHAARRTDEREQRAQDREESAHRAMTLLQDTIRGHTSRKRDEQDTRVRAEAASVELLQSALRGHAARSGATDAGE
jgi:hypothetical protein